MADKLNDGEPRWSDWHEASNPETLNFSGRWTGEVFLTPEQQKRIANKEEVDLSGNPNYLRFSDDPNLADEVIARQLGYRMAEIATLKEMLSTKYPAIDLMTFEYTPYTPTFSDTGMALYYTKKLLSIYCDEWVAESAIYDLEGWTVSLDYFFERVRKNPDKQFLIPVDFHH